MLLSAALVNACMKCAVRPAVKVIHRRMRERTIEKLYTHTYKYIYRGFPLSTTHRCSLASLANNNIQHTLSFTCFKIRIFAYAIPLAYKSVHCWDEEAYLKGLICTIFS